MYQLPSMKWSSGAQMSVDHGEPFSGCQATVFWGWKKFSSSGDDQISMRLARVKVK